MYLSPPTLLAISSSIYDSSVSVLIQMAGSESVKNVANALLINSSKLCSSLLKCIYCHENSVKFLCVIFQGLDAHPLPMDLEKKWDLSMLMQMERGYI